MSTLELALEGDGKHEEAIVARELRAIAGGLDDGAHVELRTRRLDAAPPDRASAGSLGGGRGSVLGYPTLRANVVPQDTNTLFLDLAVTVAGSEEKLAPADRAALGLPPRGGAVPSSHPVLAKVERIAGLLGIPKPETALSTRVPHPRVAILDGTWLVVPESLGERAEPVIVAALTRALVRIALCLPWLDDLSGPTLFAALSGIARQADPDFAPELSGDDEELVSQFARRAQRAIGRKQRKALAELAPALANLRAPTAADVAAFERGIARTELRVAFLVTGDLLGTIDCVRLGNPELSAATAEVGPKALVAALGHPLAGDVATFALSGVATELRRRVGTVWHRGG